MNVLLDLDGTLTDPAVGILGCIRHALDGLGVACPPDAEMRRFIGPPLWDTFGQLLGRDEARVARAIELYRERFGTVGMFENGVYPGIEEALGALRGRGARLFVATSKPHVFARRIVEHFALDRHVEKVYGSELDGTRADKTDLIRHLLAEEHLEAGESVMVGDRLHDMEGARANQVRAIGVLWGYGTRRELASAGASALCPAPQHLPTLVFA